MAYEGMIAETISIRGDNNEPISAYVARPLGAGPFPGMVLIHHAPVGRVVPRDNTPLCASRLCGNQPQPLSPRRRRQGGRCRRQGARRGRRSRRAGRRRHRGRRAMAARPALAQRQGRRDRHLLRRPADVPVCLQDQEHRCGGRTVGRPRRDEPGGAEPEATGGADRVHKGPVLPAARPVRQRGPLPDPGAGRQHEAELKKHGKQYEFHRYDGAGHGFFYYDRPMYRVEQALDGWQKVWAFFGKHLAG